MIKASLDRDFYFCLSGELYITNASIADLKTVCKQQFVTVTNLYELTYFLTIGYATENGCRV